MKKISDKRKKQAIVAGIILLLIWWFCGFGGSKPWVVDLNRDLGSWACPGKCWLNNTNGSEGGDGDINPTTTCSPLSTRFESRSPDMYNTVAQLCLVNNGTFTHTNYEVSCETPTSVISCEGQGNVLFAYDCHELGGTYHCQDNWVGCYCTGSGPEPYGEPNECDKTWTWGYGNLGYSCDGPCRLGDSCKDIDGTCGCAPEQDSCYLVGGRTCGGGCTNQYKECMYDPKYETCLCDYPIPT